MAWNAIETGISSGALDVWATRPHAHFTVPIIETPCRVTHLPMSVQVSILRQSTHSLDTTG